MLVEKAHPLFRRNTLVQAVEPSAIFRRGLSITRFLTFFRHKVGQGSTEYRPTEMGGIETGVGTPETESPASGLQSPCLWIARNGI